MNEALPGGGGGPLTSRRRIRLNESDLEGTPSRFRPPIGEESETGDGGDLCQSGEGGMPR